MKQILDQLGKLQFDQLRWQNELIFATKEIELYQKRIIGLFNESSKEQKKEELSSMLNEFELQKEIALNIRLKIKKQILKNKKLTAANGSLKNMLNTNHLQTHETIDLFRSQYAKLKQAFHHFSTLQDN